VRYVALLLGCLALLAGYLIVKDRENPSPVVATITLPDPIRVTLSEDQGKQAAALGGFVQTPLSLLRVSTSMRYGEFVWNDDRIPPGPVWVRVDLRTQLLSVFRAGHEIGTAVVLFGADEKPTPLGRFPILWKGKDHQSSLYDAPMPFTLRLTGDGVSIHGSDVRWGAATHGCIGVPTEFARHLYDVTKVGDPVAVLRSTAA
jgi:L,D-transpeptidase catalytic domain